MPGWAGDGGLLHYPMDSMTYSMDTTSAGGTISWENDEKCKLPRHHFVFRW